MPKRILAMEREAELNAVWGSDSREGLRVPQRRRRRTEDDEPLVEADEKPMAKPSEKVKGKKPKTSTNYALHCVVGHGTTVNDVRRVFEDYEPRVEIRTTQKGNLLNKSQYAVLTFRNKALALHAVKCLDGRNQRDLMGVTRLQLALMLSREQNKIIRRTRRITERKEASTRLKGKELEEEALLHELIKNV